MLPIPCKAAGDMLGQETLLNLVWKVGSHEKGAAQIQDFNIQVHCSSTLHVGGLKLFKGIAS
jgi:hypothetical protein